MHYDTVNFQLKRSKECDVNFINYIDGRLENVSSGLNNYGNEWIKGYIDEVSVYATENVLKVDRTSLPRIIKGSNQYSVTLAEVEEKIISLSDQLELPLYEANLTRLDLASDLYLNHPTSFYLGHFGNKPNGKKQTFFDQANTGITYIQKGVKNTYYSKVAEVKFKHNQIIPENINREPFRGELSLSGNPLQKVLKDNPNKVKTLYEPNFFNSLVLTWEENYHIIEKLNYQFMQIQPPRTPKELNDILAYIGVNTIGGNDKLLSQLIHWQKNGLISADFKFQAKKKMKQNNKLSKEIMPIELIEELDSKVNEAVKQNLL